MKQKREKPLIVIRCTKDGFYRARIPITGDGSTVKIALNAAINKLDTMFKRFTRVRTR